MTVLSYSLGMDGNPITHTEITGDEIATPKQRRLHRAEQKQRLRDQVERMLRALEAVPDPKDFAGVERMAKAAVAVNKALDDICPEAQPNEAPQEEDEMNEEFGPDGERRPPRDALDAWYTILERKLDRLAAAHGQKTISDELGPPEVGSLGQRLGSVGATRPDAAGERLA
jgi:hypothetical protein